MTEKQNPKRFDLEDRTLAFARRGRSLVRKLVKSPANLEDGKQLIRSSGSVGSIYIEANEALGKKDFIMRIKICRKEAKESCYWLRLLEVGIELEQERQALEQEAIELTNIFGPILRKIE